MHSPEPRGDDKKQLKTYLASTRHRSETRAELSDRAISEDRYVSFRTGQIRLAALLGVALCVSGVSGGQALESHTYVVTASSAYGGDDCLDDGAECGGHVECETYGQGIALNFSGLDTAGASNGS